jgi:peptide deformylase
LINRPEKVKVRYYKADGETQVETWMDGMDARCFQHECEHLRGELFLDAVSEFKLKRAYTKREKLFRKLSKKMKA